MSMRISIGAQDFEYLRRRDCFYIDKTSFIKEWWENEDIVTLITRPRRFGKTLNMSMMEKFFSNQYENRGEIFEGLSIWREEAYRSLQGSYPVIFLSFASIKGSTYEETVTCIRQLVVELYGKYEYLKDSLNEKEVEFYDSVNLNMEKLTMVASLRKLCFYLSEYYGKRVLIFLDEYDTPLQEAYINGYWEQMASFIRAMFNSTFKTNPYMERAILTGITRVSKESIFSDLNNLDIVTTTSDKYATSFGFTEEEVFLALEKFSMSNQRLAVKHWYDGFTFGVHTDIYNPWSITNFLDKKKFDTYWANTSSNSLVNQLIQKGNPEIKIIMEDLLAGKNLITEIDEQIIFSQLENEEKAIWSLFLASGYLKVIKQSVDIETAVITYELALTNIEVRAMFQRMIQNWFSNYSTSYNDFIKALFLNDIKYMNRFMNRVAKDTFSFFDTGKKPSEETQPERFYHGFVLGLIVDLTGRYHITSNRESGFGRYDVLLEPIKNSEDFAYIFEFKVHDKDEEASLEETVKEALRQIEEKNYDSILLAKGIPEEKIRHYGFAFEGKKVLIG
ncbi:MAG: AAA family ATPase [Lachnospiraceae bacterium]